MKLEDIDPRLLKAVSFALADGIKSVRDSKGALIPFALLEDAAGKRTVHRFVAQPYEVSVEKAVSFLRDNTDAAILVIAYDGFVTMDGARTDAIMVRGYVNGATKTVAEVAPISGGDG